MYQLHITKARLSDGSHVYNGRLGHADPHQPQVQNMLPDEINFVTEADARQFADQWLNLFLHRTNTQAEVKYHY